MVFDNFNAADHAALTTTSDGTATWTIHAGTWEHLSNQAHSTAASGAGAVASIDCGNADGTVQATLATTQVALLFRVVDSANFYAAFSNSLFRVVGGTFANILGYTVTSPATISVVMAGSLITVYNGGSALGHVTDSTFSTTRHGIQAQRLLSTDLIDDWSFVPPARTGGWVVGAIGQGP